MIKWLTKRKQKKEERKKLKQYKKYYKVVKGGQVFLQFIFEDIAQQKKDKVNRAQRRRFEKALGKEAKLTPEMVQHYRMKIDNVLRYIDVQLNPPKIKKQKVSGYQPKGPKIRNPKTPKGGTGESSRKTPFNDDDILKAEYKLIQEKKSNLPANERKKIVSLYKQRFVGVKK